MRFKLKEHFPKTNVKFVSDIKTFLSDTSLPTTRDENYTICEAETTEGRLFIALKSKPNCKTPENNRLSEEIHASFLEGIKKFTYH